LLCHRVLSALFLAQFAIVLGTQCWPGTPLAKAGWPEGVLLMLALGTTLASLARQLPIQNVLLGCGIIAVISAAVEVLGALTSIPFGPFLYTSTVGPQLFSVLPCAVPVLWVVTLLNARGVGRLILRPWRRIRTYGFWLMGLTALLAVLFDFGLEPFACRVNHYWFWSPTKLPSNWYGAPWVNFLAWAITALLILAFATPSLINKKPVKRPPDFHPLLVWSCLNFLLAAAAAAHQLWIAAGFVLASTITAAVFACRGASW